ncbi:MAG: PaaI family thioesterase [Actinomycetota bacterium]|nr:PaaI family thioesterase [Actinomycetota bacterium]
MVVEDSATAIRQTSLAQAGASMRALQDVITGTSAPSAELDHMATAMDAITKRLTPYRRAIKGVHNFENYVDAAPAHTLTPEFEVLEQDANSLRGRVRFGLFYRNAFGIANGGAIALMFDTAMAYLGSTSDIPAYTASLQVDFRRGAPIDADLTVLVRRGSTEGRKHELSAQLFEGDVLLSEASCLMVEPRDTGA